MIATEPWGDRKSAATSGQPGPMGPRTKRLAQDRPDRTRQSSPWLAALFALSLAVHDAPAAPAAPEQDMTDRPPRPQHPMAPDRHDPPRARDGEAAIREELAAARTREALELFIARHPADPLAEEARRRLGALPR